MGNDYRGKRIMEKKKLLLTVGCGFVSGETASEPQYNLGSVLKTKLGYDEHINMGVGATGINRQMETFLDEIEPISLSEEYDVTLFLLVTYPYRMGFYVNGKHKTIHIDSYRSSSEFVNIFKDDFRNTEHQTDELNTDLILEQYKYVHFFQKISKICGWNFIHGLVEHVHNDRWINLLTERSNFELKDSFINEEIINMNKPPLSNHILSCNHPDDTGYEIVAENIFRWVARNRNELINYENQ